MYTLISMVSGNKSLMEYKDSEDLEQSYGQYGCNGVEIIRCGEDERNIIGKNTIIGFHVGFYSQWIDFWNGNEEALIREFGSAEVYEGFYNGKDRDALLKHFKKELDYAQEMGAHYVVFHVSDVSAREVFTYQRDHTDAEVIDASIDMINTLLDNSDYSFEFLMENLWWPGFTMANPLMTKRLMEGIHYPKKGIMLDIGHLMNTNIHLSTLEEACAYIHQLLDAHGELSEAIRGVHLHHSLTGEYVKNTLKHLPVLKEDFYERFAEAYEHVLKIDTHQPVSGKTMTELIGHIAPHYLVHEFAAQNRAQREESLAIQTQKTFHAPVHGLPHLK